MNLEVMSYKNYQWPYNPQSLEIMHQRNLKEQIVPFYGNVIQDFGKSKRIVKGEGIFFGKSCDKDLSLLKEAFDEKGSGILRIPNITPFLASFKSLNIKREAKPSAINYTFEFWEEFSDDILTSNDFTDDYHIVKDGDTLYSISAIYNISVDSLLALNKFIKRPDSLIAGQKVILK